MWSTRLLGLAVCATMVATKPVLSATHYGITITGLTDIEHTRSDGYRYSNAYSYNNAGQILGYSDRFLDAASMGRTTWLYSDGTATNIGLIGSNYTRSDGYRYSYSQFLNNSGFAAGYSRRYSGLTDLGYDSWLYNGSNSIVIGLTGNQNTRSDGYRQNLPQNLTQSGKVLGYAIRYNGGTSPLGESAWIYNGASTIEVGLSGTEHTSSTGVRDTFGSSINEAGQAIGVTFRYNGGSTDLGQSAWFYNGSSTVKLGYTDSTHTRYDGYRYSSVFKMNESGQVIGTSKRFSFSPQNFGQTAWLYDSGSTIKLGITDSTHTRYDGYQFSQVNDLNEAGQVLGNSYSYPNPTKSWVQGETTWLYSNGSTKKIGLYGDGYTDIDGRNWNFGALVNESGQAFGTATRYDGTSTSDLGRTTWMYSDGNTTEISLRGTEFTTNTGYIWSNGTDLNDAGQMIGQSRRYNGGTIQLGEGAWFYSDGITKEIGLEGAIFTRSDNYQFNTAQILNVAGQVAGYAERYAGSTAIGQSAWLYDMSIDQTYSMDLSIRSDGYAYSRILYLGDDGLALGYYELFGADDSMLGIRAFSFTSTDGPIDLGRLIIGGIDSTDWQYLANAVRADNTGQIFGYGLLDDMSGGQMSYLLSPQIVPIPPVVYLFSSGLLGLIGIARTKKAA